MSRSGVVTAAPVAVAWLAAVITGPAPAAAETAGETTVVDGVVEVTVRSPDGAIDDLRSGRLIVLVRNLAPERLAITRLAPVEIVTQAEVALVVGPALGCAAAGGEPAALCVVPPGHQALFPVDVTIDALSRTGRTLVAFDVGYRRDGTGAGNVVVVAGVTLGVFGESELAPLLQIPSILVLPGAAFLVLALLLWRLGARPAARGPDDFPFKAAGLEFWLAAVGISAALVAVRGLAGRNLLTGYGYRDIRDVLLAALVLALALAGWLAGRKRWLAAREAKAAAREARRRLAPGDSAAEALGKLARWDDDRSLNLPLVEVDGRRCLRYQDGGDGTVVVGPVLAFSYADESGRAVRDDIQRLRALGRLAPLARRLEQARPQGHVTVWWDRQGALFAVGAEDCEPLGGNAPVIAWREQQ